MFFSHTLDDTILKTPAEQGGLNVFELAVYIYVVTNIRDDSPMYFSYERICKHYSAGIRGVRRAIKSLEARGLLERRYYHDKKGYRRAVYEAISIKELEKDWRKK